MKLPRKSGHSFLSEYKPPTHGLSFPKKTVAPHLVQISIKYIELLLNQTSPYRIYPILALHSFSDPRVCGKGNPSCNRMKFITFYDFSHLKFHCNTNPHFVLQKKTSYLQVGRGFNFNIMLAKMDSSSQLFELKFKNLKQNMLFKDLASSVGGVHMPIR